MCLNVFYYIFHYRKHKSIDIGFKANYAEMSKSKKDWLLSYIYLSRIPIPDQISSLMLIYFDFILF